VAPVCNFTIKHATDSIPTPAMGAAVHMSCSTTQREKVSGSNQHSNCRFHCTEIKKAVLVAVVMGIGTVVPAPEIPSPPHRTSMCHPIPRTWIVLMSLGFMGACGKE